MRKVYLNTSAAAEYLTLSKRSLEDMRGTGTGPRYYKIGAGTHAPVRYTEEDLDAWLEERHVRSSAEVSERIRRGNKL